MTFGLLFFNETTLSIRLLSERGVTVRWVFLGVGKPRHLFSFSVTSSTYQACVIKAQPTYLQHRAQPQAFITLWTITCRWAFPLLCCPGTAINNLNSSAGPVQKAAVVTETIPEQQHRIALFHSQQRTQPNIIIHYVPCYEFTRDQDVIFLKWCDNRLQSSAFPRCWRIKGMLW